MNDAQFEQEFNRQLVQMAFDADPWNRLAKWRCYAGLIETAVVALSFIAPAISLAWTAISGSEAAMFWTLMTR